MTSRKLEELAHPVIDRIRKELPLPLRRAAELCQVVLQSAPCSEPDFEDCLGLFEGLTYAELSTASHPQDMPKISLFLWPLWETAEGQLAQFHEEVRLTYLHEFAHFLGIEEHEMASWGLE